METVSWQGYAKKTFTIEDHPCFVVEPEIAAPGKPWVWRMSFPAFHSEVDQELLRLGWHVGFIGVVDLLGCDAALDLMDRFYDRVHSEWALAARPALEAVSRGGLHAYRYAVRHPERIACIYAETPVMDLKSWPVKWRGSQAEVRDAIRHYGFTDLAGLTAYQENPMDLLKTIAEAKIPLRHIISLNDEVVPPVENTLEAQRRLLALGHEMEVVGIEAGTVDSNGHHFPLPHVFESSRFIARHASVLPCGREYYVLRGGVANARAAFVQGKTGRVVFLGGSITFNPGWRDELMRYLRERFPETTFDFIAAGIPSVGSNGHTFRLDRDVLAHGPVDLVFFEAAVNDAGNCAHRPIERLRGAEGTIRRLREENPSCDIVMMQFVSPEDIESYRSGGVPDTVDKHERVAAHYNCPSLNLSREVTDRIAAGEFTWNDDFKNVHPSPYGQRVYASSIMRLLDAAFATDTAPVAHGLPAMLLDPYSYSDGRFGRLESARVISGFTLDPDWCPTDGKSTRAGFVHVPALTGERPGDRFEYTFEGRGVGLFLAAGPDAGTIEVSVDGGAVRIIDTFSPWSAGLHLPWVVMLADELASGTHTVRVSIAADRHPKSTGTAIRVIHFLVNG